MIFTTFAIVMGSATVSDSAKAITHTDFGFTAAQLARADKAIISAATGNINLLYTGDAPTATVGHPALGGATPP